MSSTQPAISKLTSASTSAEPVAPPLLQSATCSYLGRSIEQLEEKGASAQVAKNCLQSQAAASATDSSAVMLATDDPCGYMNRVQYPGLSEEFYVSKMPYSREAYWSFITQQQVSIGISLLEIPPFPPYLPSKERRTHQSGEFLIRWIEEIKIGGVDYKRLEITHLETDFKREFDHFTLMWINLRIASDADFKQFMRLYLERIDQLSDPVVHLHCRSGHGRSGTLLLARILMTQPEGTVAEELLESLRSQRAQLVENEEQFHFAIQQASDLSEKSFVAGQFKSSARKKHQQIHE